MARDSLDGIRPSADRRSWWLREALAAEDASEAGFAPAAAPPFAGSGSADVVVLGGGYTGLWTALRVAELAPGARVVLLESDICGGGPSGRNGGFVTAWWDELPTLVEDFGASEALRVARAVSGAVDAVGDWTAERGADVWFRKAGSLTASAAAAQDGGWREAVETCERLGVDDEFVELSAAEVRERVASPVFRGGVFMRAGATVQPARLARALRAAALERGVVIHEATRASSFEGGLVRTSSSAGTGVVRGDKVVVALNAWAAAWPAFGRRLVTWSSYIVLTEPIPDALAEIGWTGGEGLSDARFTLHYLRTTPDGRIALGGGGGRAGFGGRIGRAFTDDAESAVRAAHGLRRLFPSLAGTRIDDAWGGPIDIASDHLPFFGTVDRGRVHFGHGYSGNGVGPAWVGGRILASLALGLRDEWSSLPIVGRVPRAFPPEPLRYLGARVVREAIVRRETLEERGRRPGWLMRELTRVPRRMGYHLGLDR
jgi:glycine/D-amino acid oxidase-like deaminating enzyme